MSKILEPESERLEFKSSAIGKLPDDIWKSISAFSNADGGKIILFRKILLAYAEPASIII